MTRTEESKADFSRIYDREDARAYFGTLVPLDYQITQQALPVVERVLAEAGPRAILDVCCSYGINASLLRCAVDLDEVGSRNTDPARATLPAEDVIAQDAAFYAARLRHPERRVLGLDVSAPAITYGRRTGLLADGWAEDLESTDPSPELVAGLRDVGLVVCTGGVGYIGVPTFERIVRAVAEPANLWLAVFVLRVFDYAEIAASLAGFGLVTERLPETFPQRRFADRAEADAAVDDVRRRGLDPTGKEADGWFHADCYLTRPAAAPGFRTATLLP